MKALPRLFWFFFHSGIVNSLKVAGIAAFGPTREAARLETDKAFAKAFMSRHDVPTARWKAFTDAKAAVDFVTSETDFEGLVVKASGLAAGKGVTVCQDA